MLKFLDRLFVTCALLSCLGIFFFDAIFQTSGQLTMQEMIEGDQLLTSAILTPFQRQALNVLFCTFLISAFSLCITGVLTWTKKEASRVRKLKNRGQTP